jgi:hypothetical protein
MATEFTVILENGRGLARLGIVLGDAMVNIEPIHGNAREKSAIVQFVSNDQDTAARALDAAGIACSRREVLIVRVLDEPGTLGDLAVVMSQAGINIESVYVATRGHVVLGVDAPAGATQLRRGYGRDDSRMSQTLRCGQCSRRSVLTSRPRRASA